MSEPFTALAGLASREEQRRVVWFRVNGKPEPKGSTRSFKPKNSPKIVTTSDNPRLKGWASLVIDAASEAFTGRPVIEGPVRVEVKFVLARNAGHFGSGRNAGQLRDSAPAWPIVKPDLDKLVRGLLDGITQAGVWRDDSRVVEIRACKEYGDHPGAIVIIREATR